MDKERKLAGKMGLSRRDFLKVSAAGAAGAGLAGFAEVGPAAAAVTGSDAAHTYHTTCPYCSASCGQLVAVDSTTGTKVLDIYGDFRSPFNSGGLCAKGAGAYQLATNARRIGAWTPTELGAMRGGLEHHPVDDVFMADPDNPGKGYAYKRTGNGTWSAVDLDVAFADIATKLKTARDLDANWATTGYNSKRVAFFGSSHMNNEQNYVYKKIICNFGTNNVEHQARI